MRYFKSRHYYGVEHYRVFPDGSYQYYSLRERAWSEGALNTWKEDTYYVWL